MAKPLVRILFGIELLDAVMTEVCPDKSVAEREPKLGENLHYAMFFHEHTLALQRIMLPAHDFRRKPTIRITASREPTSAFVASAKLRDRSLQF